MAKLSSLFEGVEVDRLLYTPSDKFVLPRCPVGIEIEVENMRLLPGTIMEFPQFSDYWVLHQEGSLRNYGQEFTSKKLFGEDILVGLNLITKLNELQMSTGELSFDPSWRCGLHIHLDVSDMTSRDLTTFIAFNLLFENALIKLTGNRQSNVFCVPAGTCRDHLVALSELNRQRMSDRQLDKSLVHLLQQCEKYTAINYAPVPYQGSVEYRMHEGTIDEERIVNWINILMCIKKYAMEFTEQGNSTVMYPEHISGVGFEDILSAVFGPYATFFETDNCDAELWEGMRIMQDFLLYTRLQQCITYLPRMEQLMSDGFLNVYNNESEVDKLLYYHKFPEMVEYLKGAANRLQVEEEELDVVWEEDDDDEGY